MGRRISKEFLHPSILDGVNNKIGNLDSLETDAKGNMVQAINELVEKLDNSAEIENGKKLIANAVGEPLTAEDSFDEMSNDINSLLNTFKTNMMNNGITVESGDKFKALIDKIKGLTEGEGKGIQFAEGICEFKYNSSPITTSIRVDTVPINLDFQPTFIFIFASKFSRRLKTLSDSTVDTKSIANNIYLSNMTMYGDETETEEYFKISNITNESFDIEYKSFKSSKYCTFYNYEISNWYAIGVGEEDTTLRDSLASILGDKGVDVSDEDDMASLITKVDEEFDKSKIKQLVTTGYNIRSGGYGTVGVFAIMDNGELWACGTNTSGKLGLGDTANRSAFEKVNISDVKEIICGPSVTYIIKNDGSAWGCGSVSLLGIEYSDYGIPTFTQLPEPVNTNVKEISCGEGYTMILKNDGTLWGIGYNNFGSLGLGNRVDAGTFTQATVNTDNIRHVECKGAITFIYKNDGSVWFAGFVEDYIFGELSSYNQQQTTFYKLL